MVNLTINGQKISVSEGTTILEAALKVGIDIPHLCYLKDINEIGACRVCVVENAGMETLVTACNTPVEEGMELYTNSPKAREARRINVSLILSDHDAKCATCVRSGNCNLQKIANDLGILEVPYANIAEKQKWDKKQPLIRDASKCIKCMRCIQICDHIQGLNVWGLTGTFRSVRPTVPSADSASPTALWERCVKEMIRCSFWMLLQIRKRSLWFRSHRLCVLPGVKASDFTERKARWASWWLH